MWFEGNLFVSQFFLILNEKMMGNVSHLLKNQENNGKFYLFNDNRYCILD